MVHASSNYSENRRKSSAEQPTHHAVTVSLSDGCSDGAQCRKRYLHANAADEHFGHRLAGVRPCACGNRLTPPTVQVLSSLDALEQVFRFFDGRHLGLCMQV